MTNQPLAMSNTTAVLVAALATGRYPIEPDPLPPVASPLIFTQITAIVGLRSLCSSTRTTDGDRALHASARRIMPSDRSVLCPVNTTDSFRNIDALGSSTSLMRWSKPASLKRLWSSSSSRRVLAAASTPPRSMLQKRFDQVRKRVVGEPTALKA